MGKTAVSEEEWNDKLERIKQHVAREECLDGLDKPLKAWLYYQRQIYKIPPGEKKNGSLSMSAERRLKFEESGLSCHKPVTVKRYETMKELLKEMKDKEKEKINNNKNNDKQSNKKKKELTKSSRKRNSNKKNQELEQRDIFMEFQKTILHKRGIEGELRGAELTKYMIMFFNHAGVNEMERIMEEKTTPKKLEEWWEMKMKRARGQIINDKLTTKKIGDANSCVVHDAERNKRKKEIRRGEHGEEAKKRLIEELKEDKRKRARIELKQKEEELDEATKKKIEQANHYHPNAILQMFLHVMSINGNGDTLMNTVNSCPETMLYVGMGQAHRMNEEEYTLPFTAKEPKLLWYNKEHITVGEAHGSLGFRVSTMVLKNAHGPNVKEIEELIISSFGMKATDTLLNNGPYHGKYYHGVVGDFFLYVTYSKKAKAMVDEGTIIRRQEYEE